MVELEESEGQPALSRLINNFRFTGIAKVVWGWPMNPDPVFHVVIYDYSTVSNPVN